jgi:hypothetical protein
LKFFLAHIWVKNLLLSLYFCRDKEERKWWGKFPDLVKIVEMNYPNPNLISNLQTKQSQFSYKTLT